MELIRASILLLIGQKYVYEAEPHQSIPISINGAMGSSNRKSLA